MFKEVKAAYSKHQAGTKATRNADSGEDWVRRAMKSDNEIKHNEFARHHTDSDTPALTPRVLAHPNASARTPGIGHADRDLPSLVSPHRTNDEAELHRKMTILERLLAEADCLWRSAAATIERLQRNPKALIAVALTLAEISDLVARMAPGVLVGLKVGYPAAVALLASPQFLVTVVVSVGVTVIALGGYKIVKRIRVKRKEDAELKQLMELQDFEGSVGRIVDWRKGIAEEEVQRIGETVNGKFITPCASGGSIEGDVLRSAYSRSSTLGRYVKDVGNSESGNMSNRPLKASTSPAGGKGEITKGKKKSPGLRMLFQSRSEN